MCLREVEYLPLQHTAGQRGPRIEPRPVGLPCPSTLHFLPCVTDISVSCPLGEFGFLGGESYCSSSCNPRSTYHGASLYRYLWNN